MDDDDLDLIRITNPRAIADRKRLSAVLGTCVEPGQLTPFLREFLETGQKEIDRRFSDARDLKAGRRAVIERSFLIDQLIRSIHDIASLSFFKNPNPTTGERLSIVALGGYGRGELAPYSDIDLLFLQGYRTNPWAEQVVEFILYRLWDLGLKPGYAVRTAEDALHWAKNDLHAKTSMLEMRLVAGDAQEWLKIRKLVQDKLFSSSFQNFVAKKTTERDQRLDKFGQSRFTLEPNVKEGKGGLRDLHFLRWLILARPGKRPEKQAFAEFLTPAEQRRFERAEDLLLLFRVHLHLMANRAEERLAFETQADLTQRLGIQARPGLRPVERLMRLYFRNARLVGRLTHAILTRLEAPKDPGAAVKLENFIRRKNSLAAADETQFEARPSDCLRLFVVAQDYGLNIDPASLQIAAKAMMSHGERYWHTNQEANELFLRLLTSAKVPEYWLGLLSEVGIFGRFLPDFARIVGQVQFDMYHHFTVDDHTIRAIGKLNDLLTGALAVEIPALADLAERFHKDRPPLLFLAVLLHDIAKGQKRDHSEVGAEIAMRLGPRFGLGKEDIETVSWLVRHHLLLSNTAFRRNLDDPKTIEKFVAQVEQIDRLHYLLLLTIADIKAVGPKTWTSWKAQLLFDLYARAEEALSGEISASGRENRVGERKTDLAVELQRRGWEREKVSAYAAALPPGYVMAFSSGELAKQAQRLDRFADGADGAFDIDFTTDVERGVTLVTVICKDRLGLVAQLAGGFALAGTSIADARIFTLDNGMIVDRFALQDVDGEPLDPIRLIRLRSILERVLNDPESELTLIATLPPHHHPAVRAFPVTPRVRIFNDMSDDYTVIEIACRDRRALVYDIASALSHAGISIANAKISTFGHRAIDSFYVTDHAGEKIHNEQRCEELTHALSRLLEPGGLIRSLDTVPMDAEGHASG